MPISKISQIFIRDDAGELPPFLKQAVSTVQGGFPRCVHHIYDKNSLRSFISENYDAEVLWAFDNLKPYAYKADLGRYCILHKFGGWYFDISIRLVSAVELPDNIEALLFRDIQRYSLTSWAVQVSVIYSIPSNSIFRTAIDYVVKHCKEKYYGITPLCPTGPTVLGRAVAVHGANPKMIFGDYLQLTPSYVDKSAAYVFPGGSIFALHKPSGGGDLASLGAKGTNNYIELWNARKIYGE